MEALAIKPPLISLDNVSVVKGSKRVLADLSIEIQEGEHVAILGPNGCGKSTLIRTITRELYPYGGEGTVKIGGVDRWRIAELRTALGVVSDEPRAPLIGNPTGLELAVSGLLGTYGVVQQHSLTDRDWEAARESLGRVQAQNLASQTIETLSTGERRRCWIARALISKPRALILDEPTTGLDMRAAYEFNQIVRELARSGLTILLITHHLEEIIPEIRRIIMMKEGKIVADGPRQVLLTPGHLVNLFNLTSTQCADLDFSSLNYSSGSSPISLAI